MSKGEQPQALGQSLQKSFATRWAPVGGTFVLGISLIGNPRGSYAPSRERARFNSEFISALLRDFRQGGPAAIAKVRKYQPAAYMKICALMVPKEMKVEHSDGIKAMTDEQLDEALEALQELLAERAEAANVIEGTVEPVALPAPEARSSKATPEPTRKHYELPDEGGRHGGRPPGAQAEQAMKLGRGRDFAFALLKMK